KRPVYAGRSAKMILPRLCSPYLFTALSLSVLGFLSGWGGARSRGLAHKRDMKCRCTVCDLVTPQRHARSRLHIATGFVFGCKIRSRCSTEFGNLAVASPLLITQS